MNERDKDPELTVPDGADLHLEEPQLGTAAISDDVAESTALNDVAAEAAQVAEEAQATGTLVAGNEFHAPAAPSLPTAEPADPGAADPGAADPGAADPGAADAGAARAEPRAARISPAEPKKPLFTPEPPAGTTEAASSGAGNRRLFVVIGAAVVAVLLIIGLIWLLVALLNPGKDTSTAAGTPSASPASASITGTASGSPQATPSAAPSASGTSAASPSGNGLITADVPPPKWAKGDCFRAFKDASQNADIVNCATPHAAQLVSTYSYPETSSYPGLDALKAKAAETCSSVKLSSAANNYTYKPKSGYPSESTWAKGDRRVDCIILDDSGDNIRESLLS